MYDGGISQIYKTPGIVTGPIKRIIGTRASVQEADEF
jgi:hypothetical protein